eukprot:9726544-Alexandrium_andersonii.AAC.1
MAPRSTLNQGQDRIRKPRHWPPHRCIEIPRVGQLLEIDWPPCCWHRTGAMALSGSKMGRGPRWTDNGQFADLWLARLGTRTG